MVDLMRVHISWDKGGTEPENIYMFCYGKGCADHHLDTGFFIHKGIISVVKRVRIC
jgi:hypothetical protein